MWLASARRLGLLLSTRNVNRRMVEAGRRYIEEHLAWESVVKQRRRRCMRIAFVTFEYPPFIIGGAGVYANHVTEALANLGHQVVVFTPSISDTNSTKYPASANLQVWHVQVHETISFKALQFWINLPREIKKPRKRENSISYTSMASPTGSCQSGSQQRHTCSQFITLSGMLPKTLIWISFQE